MGSAREIGEQKVNITDISKKKLVEISILLAPGSGKEREINDKSHNFRSGGVQ